jgi:hypothetical protein
MPALFQLACLALAAALGVGDEAQLGQPADCAADITSAMVW